MQKTCVHSRCKQAFEVTDDDLAFYAKMSPTFCGQKQPIPASGLCPECRSKRRMVWRNERSLCLRPCERCKKNNVSMFAPDAAFHTYCHDCFYGDGWDPESYGREYDFSKNFRDNVEGLLKDVPLMMLFQSGINENCDYTNYFGPDSRNCYLMYNSGRDEDCSYSRGLIESKSCMDMLIGSGNQFCYECINVNDSYKVLFTENAAQCSDSAFLFNCRRCRNCFGCTNLVEKEYHLWNKPCKQDEFSAHMSGLSSASFVSEMREKFMKLKRECIHRENNNINTESCTGDYLAACKNCIDCYEMKGSEDCKRMLCSKLCKDSHDIFGFGYDSELLYDCIAVGLSNSVVFSWACTSVSDSLYCLQCDNLQHCFGCVGLRHNKYCILNKQYSKEDYESLVSTIIGAMKESGEWGEFLPWDVSPFAYNDTVAQEFMPLTKSAATSMGFRWNDALYIAPPATKTIAAALLPDAVSAIPDDVLDWAIQCESTGKSFKLTKQELEFYRLMNLRVPRAHPDERHTRRMKLRNPCRLWSRQCDKCKKDIQTTYAPERPAVRGSEEPSGSRRETIYCEECYRADVY